MDIIGRTTDFGRRSVLATLALVLALGVTAGITGCSKAQDAIEEKQEEKTQQFEQDVENSTSGRAEDAQSAVELLNEQTDTTEENAQP